MYYAFLATAFLTGFLAGLELPKEPLAILPFFVLISPRPIIICFIYSVVFFERPKYKRNR